MARIMVVEDNALNIKLFCDLLGAHGHDTRAVTDSREAIDTARDFEPDLMITDIQLPHVDGMELMRLIRGEPHPLSAIPIMAVTAYAGEGDDERIRGAGAQAYVSKPISVVRFIETVEGLLSDGPIADKGAEEDVASRHDESGPESGAASTLFDHDRAAEPEPDDGETGSLT